MAQSAIYNLDVYQPGSLKASAYLKSVVLLYDAVPFAGTSGYSRFEKTKRLNKSGIFEFEADVHFLDPAVKWVATLLTFACHTILKTMSNSRSPIFWKNNDNGISQTANNYLVELSYSLIDQALENPENLRHIIYRR
ncbi:MAG: hypothetical protein HN417_08430 [Desulfobacula sp.]|nr:hypothetical protein [Desulfobacula sp.]